MRNKAFLLISMITITLLSTSLVFAQWPDDPDSNMIICNHSGEQAIPLVAGTSDGGCYICWYDNASGNYDLYLQRLNASGEIQWIENGLLISDHPQESWLTSYDMAVDHDDNAIVVINDIRSGADWDIYAYQISSDGGFLWGDDGKTISDNDGFEPSPQVTITTNGNIVVGWQEESTIHLRKLAPDGQDYWYMSNVISISSEFGISMPRLAPSDNDGVILQALIQTGPNYWDPSDIYMFKFTDYGDTAWSNSGVVVSNAGGIGMQMIPELTADGSGGAYSFWYDSRISSELHAFAQHINAQGEAQWDINGIRMSQSPSQFQMNPALTYLEQSGNVLVTYKTTNTSQALSGIGGQLLNASGELLWGVNGIDLISLENKGRYSVNAYPIENDFIVTCFDSPTDDVVNSYIDAMRINLDGEHVWTESPKMISSHQSEKIHLATCMTTNDQIVSVWEDRWHGPADIYLQNINPDGTLGPYITSIEDKVSLPDNTCFQMAYPNPFNASTTIHYTLSANTYLKLEIFDLLGRKVETLVDSYHTIGEYNYNWNAGNLSTGIYFARLTTQNNSSMQKLVLLK